jgi:small subunit ribosomal protein S18
MPRTREFGERERETGSPAGRRVGSSRRRRSCRLCVEKIDYVDYKDVKLLQSFVPERAKIMPRRISGACAMHQRKLMEAIKRARNIALLPYTTP